MKTSLAGVQLMRGNGQPLHQQVARYIRGLILDGVLRPGSAISSSRAIASELGCSRTIVLEALDLLYAEGYLESLPRGSVRVASTLPEAVLQQRRDPFVEGTSREITISSRWRALTDDKYEMDSSSVFSPGTPDIEDFPFDHWARISRRMWQKPGKNLSADVPAAGYYWLRVQISEFLRNVRGMICHPEEVVITNGSSSALDFCSRMLVEPGDEVWIEEPGFIEARWALQAAGAKLVPVPVDQEGLQVEEGIRRAPNAKLAVVTPSHQYPLGVVMSPQRRLALLQWARERNGWIIEDDYNSEFRRHGNIIASLKSLDQHDRVIYLGTFSKLLFPGLRLGYLVASKEFSAMYAKGRARLDVQTPIVAQPVLAEFIRDGSMLQHLRRMRKLYAERHDAMTSAIERHMSAELTLADTNVGLHMIAYFTAAASRRISDKEVAARSKAVGAFIQPLSQSYIGNQPQQGLVFGYSKVPAEAADDRVRALRSIFY